MPSQAFVFYLYPHTFFVSYIDLEHEYLKFKFAFSPQSYYCFIKCQTAILTSIYTVCINIFLQLIISTNEPLMSSHSKHCHIPIQSQICCHFHNLSFAFSSYTGLNPFTTYFRVLSCDVE